MAKRISPAIKSLTDINWSRWMGWDHVDNHRRDATLTNMSATDSVDAHCVSELRIAAKECLDRGLVIATKWFVFTSFRVTLPYISVKVFWTFTIHSSVKEDEEILPTDIASSWRTSSSSFRLLNFHSCKISIASPCEHLRLRKSTISRRHTDQLPALFNSWSTCRSSFLSSFLYMGRYAFYWIPLGDGRRGCISGG